VGALLETITDRRPFQNGLTPLLSAAEEGHASVCKLLLSRGAAIEAASQVSGVVVVATIPTKFVS